MHPYRTHLCNELNISHIDQIVKLSGWVHRKRDHGNLLFIDLRDHYGITQLVIDSTSKIFELATQTKAESVITIIGKVVERTADTINHEISTGKIEIQVQELLVESESDLLPMQVYGDQEYPEEIRLKYRFLDLRRAKTHNNMILRSKVIAFIRKSMHENGFIEFQTPILTATSPEGARDYLVPSRVHHGKFYALPQAPQQFKQLLMVSGFDRYFQIAPCFRDEDGRADRSPGEFYQLDLEMSFVTQEDVFTTMEPILYNLFKEFSNDKHVTPYPFKRIQYNESLEKYGIDKPDLRNPIEMFDATSIFKDSNFSTFNQAIKLGKKVKAIPAPNTAQLPRSFFDNMIEFAKANGAMGLAYITLTNEGEYKSPIAKFLTEEQLKLLAINPGNTLFFLCDTVENNNKIGSIVRQHLGHSLNLINNNEFNFCWITDFPFYELDSKTNKLDFSHNPFSMPQGGLEVLNNAKSIEDLLNIKAFQYDIVCNGVELSSGAIRNHRPDILVKAFELVGYTKETIESRFPALINAFKYGAPPHGGCAPGIDRMVMLLANEPNIREVICFPLNQQAEDLLMGAPTEATQEQLNELNIMIKPKK